MTEVTAAVIRRSGRILICQRPAGKSCGLLWEFPGGKLEPGETTAQCLEREIREELGASVTVLRQIAEVVSVNGDRTIHLHFLESALLGEPVLKEHAALRWILPEEAAQYRFCPADREMLSGEAWKCYIAEGAKTNMLKIAIPTNCTEDIVNYVAAVKALGAEPVPVGEDCDPAGFDGLILPGGADVDPARYHMPNTACGTLEPELDQIQFTVLDRFVGAQKPVLGICRGIEVLNVYFGGTLIQHLPTAQLHARDKGSREDKVHHQTTEKGSWLADLYGESLTTNSSHHQACGIMGKDLKAVMHSDEGYVEGLVHETLPVWGVQWHPERMCFAHARTDTADGSLVFRFFLKQCEQAKMEA